LPEKRFDPPSRPVDGDITQQAVLKNTDPSRVYCQANPLDAYSGVRFLQTQGWVVETHRKDGPRIVGGLTVKDGDYLAIHDQVIMSRPRELEEQYERHKAALADGRSLAIGQRGGVDPFRGPTGRLPQFTEDPREERVRS
jgi:hypothetical protein